MTDERLAAAVEASALMRRAAASGGFAAILAKGDAERGSLLLILTQRGRQVAMLERTLNASGTYEWRESSPKSGTPPAEWLEKRRRNDPDIWLIELDVPDAERFIAETTSKG